MAAGAAAALALVVALAACSGGGSSDPAAAPTGATERGGTPKSGGTLTVALAAIPSVLDPYASTLQLNWIPARNACEPLFDVSTSNEVKPVLADTVEYDQKLTYVITLRSGVKFHNGQALTAADAVASIERFTKTPGNGAYLASLLASTKATGDLQVTITLKTPSAVVPTLLATAFVMPASVQKDRPITAPANDLICTGPYRLESYQPDRQVTLIRYDGYTARSDASDGPTGKKSQYVDTMVFTPIPETSAQVQAVQTGQADVTLALPLDTYPTLEAAKSAALLSASQASSVVFNKAAGVMSKVEMRQAFAAALDMGQIMGAGFGDKQFYLLDGSIMPKTSGVWYSTDGTESYNEPDAAKVKELLAKAGYHGEKIVWLTTKADSIWYGPVEPAVQLLKEAGFTIDLQVVDQATIFERRADPTQFDLFSSGYPTYGDPLLLPYLQDGFPGSWTNPAKNTLLGQLSGEPDEAKRVEIWKKLQALIYTDVPFLKFGTVRPVIGASERTHFENADDLISGFYNVWIDEA